MNKNSFEGKRILYLEDEPLIAFDTSDSLQDLGFAEVATCYRLDDAVEKSTDTAFDVALLDINVDRKQTSLALGEELKNNGVAVIYASGNSSDAERLRADGYHFLGKPLLATDLEDCLLAALHGRQAASVA